MPNTEAQPSRLHGRKDSQDMLHVGFGRAALNHQQPARKFSLKTHTLVKESNTLVPVK
jgi:hypothetical protein